MIKLILIELNKLFHKKGIYIIWILIFLFCLANNILYMKDYDKEGYYISDYQKDTTSEIKETETSLNNYNKDKEEDKNKYVELKTKLDLLNIQKNYSPMSWQYNKTNDYLEDNIYNLNYYTYIEKNDKEKEKISINYNNLIDKFNKDNWKYFVILEKEQLENLINKEKESLKNITDKKEIEDKTNIIKNYQDQLEIINIRLNKNINYGINYLNTALLKYSEDKLSLKQYKNITNLDYKEKVAYNNTISSLNINKYIIDNKVNLNKENNLNYLLRTITEDYELFIIIIILLVAGSIISEEFNKGTVKLLLIKPYKRSKILLSKYLTSIIILLLTILFTIIIEILIGGYLFGIDSLKMKVAIYNFNIGMIQEINIFKYMIIRILYNLPLLIMILTICFAISIISLNTILSVTLTMLIYIFSNTINTLVIKSNSILSKYLLTTNWNFKYFMFGNLGIDKFVTLKSTCIVYFIYLIIIISTCFIVFNKKNIKNI